MKLANQLRGFFETLAEETQSALIELQQAKIVLDEGYDNRAKACDELFKVICDYTHDISVAMKADAEKDRKLLDEQIAKTDARLADIRKALLTGEMPARPYNAEAVTLAVKGEAKRLEDNSSGE